MGRVAVVVVLEGPDAVTERQTQEGAVVAVVQALRSAALPRDGGIFLPVEYMNGEKSEYQVFGVEDMNLMVRNRAVELVVTDVLFREEG